MSLCIKCGAIAIFTRRHELRRATKAELAELANDPMVQAAMVAWKLTKMERHGDREQ